MHPGILPIRGITVKVNDTLCVYKEYRQFRFPRQKSHRRRKKWRKDRRNWRIEEQHSMYKYGDTVLVSSHIYEQWKGGATLASAKTYQRIPF